MKEFFINWVMAPIAALCLLVIIPLMYLEVGLGIRSLFTDAFKWIACKVVQEYVKTEKGAKWAEENQLVIDTLKSI